MSMLSVFASRRTQTMAPHPLQPVNHLTTLHQEKTTGHFASNVSHAEINHCQPLDFKNVRSYNSCGSYSFECPRGGRFGSAEDLYQGNGSTFVEVVNCDYTKEVNDDGFLTVQLFQKSDQAIDVDLIDSSNCIAKYEARLGQFDAKSVPRTDAVSMLNSKENYAATCDLIDNIIGTRSSDPNNSITISNIKKNSSSQVGSKNVTSSFRNMASFNNSKDATPTVLPPCRICGARASGFHYGVNSCEACKGFFRRALKRPMVLSCTKNKKCNVKGSKRSTCRFCRYKRCISLGMSRESIKTGRYSHRKRTMDTIEIKQLQNSPNSVLDDKELDVVIKNLVAAHDSLIMSTTRVSKDLIYRRQLEYHNIYLLHKKFGNYPELIMNNSTDPIFSLDHPTKCLSNQGGKSDFSDFVKLSSPSRSLSQLSSDSGYVEENDMISERNKAIVLENDIEDNSEDVPDWIPCTRNLAKNRTNENSYLTKIDRQNTPAANNNKRTCIQISNAQKSTSDRAFVLHKLKRQGNDNMEFIRTIGTNPITRPLSEGVKQRAYNYSSYENEDQHIKCTINSKTDVGGTPAKDEVIQNCESSYTNLSKIQYGNSLTVEHKHSLKIDSPDLVHGEQCAKQSECILSDVCSTEGENVLFRSSTKDNIRVCQTTLNSCSIRNSFQQSPAPESSVRNSRNKTAQFCDGMSELKNPDSGLGLVSDVECVSSVVPETEFSKRCVVDKWNSTVDIRRESQEEIIQRAKKWIAGYVDFAKKIPGFSSLPSQDQTALLQYAWDEVYILGTYRGYNNDLGVVMMPCGKCFHVEEMDRAWGKSYSRIVFGMAEIISRQNLSPELITLLKAVCIVAPDRCCLTNSNKVAKIQWMMVTCLLRHIEMTNPGNHVIFPRLISILTSLRELSESAKTSVESGCVDFMFGYNVLSKSFMPF